ncbi:MAG: radical SAM protein [Candidatus Omnitrophota bacterium]|nr:radical SAM protein [Candidatus Omnitrophota bacterium]
MNKPTIVLVALYRYQNFPVRIMHPLLKKIDGIEPHSIFFKNCDTNIFNPPTGLEEKLFVDLITKLNPKLVGFSVLSPYAPIARRLTKLVKDNSSSLVIWGGVHPTISPESCIDEADIVCIGEGEGAMTDLARHLADGKPYESIKNLWVKGSDRIIKNPMRPLIQDLDSLPFPSYGDNTYYFINSNKITKDDPSLLDNYFWVQTSRGCPYVCSYCVNSLLRTLFKDIGPYTRRRSVNNIIKEIKENLGLSGNRTERLYFIDEVFGAEESWLNEFELKYKKEVGKPFVVEYNPKVINSTILDKLVSAGLDTISFGIQTGSDDIRNRIFHRPGKNDEILDLVKKISEYNVKIKYDLILDNPYETEQSLKGTIGFLLKLPKPLWFNLYSLSYFPNYPLTKMAIEDKHIKPEEVEIDRLMARITRNWAYVPRLLPYTEKQILQNIIWLIVWNHVKNSTIKFSVFGDSLSAKLCLNYFNLKSIVLGKVFGVGGILWRNVWIMYITNGVKYILKGDWKTLVLKIKKHILKK